MLLAARVLMLRLVEGAAPGCSRGCVPFACCCAAAALPGCLPTYPCCIRPAGRWCRGGGRGGAARSGAWPQRTAPLAPSALSACGMCRWAGATAGVELQLPTAVGGAGGQPLGTCACLRPAAVASPPRLLPPSCLPAAAPCMRRLLAHPWPAPVLPFHTTVTLQPGEMIIIDEAGRLHSRQVAEVRGVAAAGACRGAGQSREGQGGKEGEHALQATPAYPPRGPAVACLLPLPCSSCCALLLSRQPVAWLRHAPGPPATLPHACPPCPACHPHCPPRSASG